MMAQGRSKTVQGRPKVAPRLLQDHPKTAIDKSDITGTGSITGYTTGDTFSISAITEGTAPSVTKFTLTTTAGAALTTGAGNGTGLTFTPSIDTGIRYRAEHLCAVKTTGTNDTGVDGPDDLIVEG